MDFSPVVGIGSRTPSWAGDFYTVWMADDSCAVTKRAYFFLWLVFRIGHAHNSKRIVLSLNIKTIVSTCHYVTLFIFHTPSAFFSLRWHLLRGV